MLIITDSFFMHATNQTNTYTLGVPLQVCIDSTTIFMYRRTTQ